MAEAIHLHLNGGPRDDIYVAHWMPELTVVGINNTMMLSADAGPWMRTKLGRYALRRDSNGEAVPHNLEGFVEADWQGWDG